MRSAPQSVCDNTFSKFNAFRHLAFKYLICGMKESLRSKRTPRNLKSSTTGIRDLINKVQDRCVLSVVDRNAHTVFSTWKI